MVRSRLRHGAALGAICAMMPVSANAQSMPAEAITAAPDTVQPTVEAAPAEDVIVVTGSRIPQRNVDTGQPTLVVSNATIEARGYTNVAEALNDLPSFGVPGASRAGGQAGAIGSGQNFLNFFGLGDQRTLTVVNSRRFVSSNTASIFGPTGAGAQVDFNVIPTVIVDRVETIAVGGAPIYGSDAIAGTINVITKRKFKGVQLDAQYGLAEAGDAANYRLRALAGTSFADGRGNIVVGGEYNEEDGLDFEARRKKRLGSFFTTPLDPDSPYKNTYLLDRRIPGMSEFGVPLVADFIPLNAAQAAAHHIQPAVTDTLGRPVAFDRSGNLVPIDFGQQTGNLINFNGGNGYRLPGNLLSPVRRYLGTALAQYEITDRARLFVEGWYANSRGQQLRDQPVYNTALFDGAGMPDGNMIVSLDNPFLSDNARATIANALATNPNAEAQPGTFYLGRANTDLISGEGSSTVELYRLVGGIDGKLNAFGRELKYELVGNFGRSTTKGSERALVQQNFVNALNAVRDTSGNIVCAPGYENAPIKTLSSTCAPLNPFGQQISEAARDYVTTIANPYQVNRQWTVTASLAGNLFDIWGGPIGFVLGYEHRDEKSSFDPGNFYYGYADPLDPAGPRLSYGRQAPVDRISGQYNTDEAFAELRVPLIGRDQNIPGMRALELHGAARYIDNSFAGGDWTYTGDVRWEIVKGLAARANYTRSVRAPAITELFNPTSAIFPRAEDPCDFRYITGGPNPARRAANCAAAGIPAGFRSDISDFSSRGSMSGNRALKNEKADAYTFGLILNPLRNFTASFDWVNIKLRDAIEALGAEQVMEGCYDSPSYPSVYCDAITRDAAGQVTFVKTQYVNAASSQFRGLIGQLAYKFATPWLGAESNVSITANYQYTDKLEMRVGEGDRTTLRNSIGYSPHRGNAGVSYDNDGFNLGLQWEYIGKTRVDPDAAENAYQYPTVPAVSLFNLTIGQKIGDQFGVRLVVDNLLDKQPPFPVPAGGGIGTYFPTFLGRSYKIGASVKF